MKIILSFYKHILKYYLNEIKYWFIGLRHLGDNHKHMISMMNHTKKTHDDINELKHANMTLQLQIRDMREQIELLNSHFVVGVDVGHKESTTILVTKSKTGDIVKFYNFSPDTIQEVNHFLDKMKGAQVFVDAPPQFDYFLAYRGKGNKPNF